MWNSEDNWWPFGVWFGEHRLGLCEIMPMGWGKLWYREIPANFTSALSVENFCNNYRDILLSKKSSMFLTQLMVSLYALKKVRPHLKQEQQSDEKSNKNVNIL